MQGGRARRVDGKDRGALAALLEARHAEVLDPDEHAWMRGKLRTGAGDLIPAKALPWGCGSQGFDDVGPRPAAGLAREDADRPPALRAFLRATHLAGGSPCPNRLSCRLKQGQE